MSLLWFLKRTEQKTTPFAGRQGLPLTLFSITM